MAQVFICDKCGGKPIRGETVDELIQAVQHHMRKTHQMEIATSPGSTVPTPAGMPS